jgi:hypothetical protein
LVFGRSTALFLYEDLTTEGAQQRKPFKIYFAELRRNRQIQRVEIQHVDDAPH